MTAARMSVDSVRFYMRNVRTRMPFKYGVAVLTSVPILHVVVEATVENKSVRGMAADILPPKWFDKDPQKDYAANVDDLLFAAQTAADAYAMAGRSPHPFFSLWRAGYEATLSAGDARGLNHLTAGHGSSLMERALIDACGRGVELSYFDLVRTNVLGLDLGDLHGELAGVEPRRALADRPLQSISVRHTVGLADPIFSTDIPKEEVLSDGLPQSLQSYIETQHVAYFMVKVNGNTEADGQRLAAIAALLDERAGAYHVTLDGNEQYADMDSFSALLDHIETTLPAFWSRILYVEQPLERSVALNDELAEGIRAADARKPMLVDESDGDLDTFVRAMEIGYSGISSKACKGLVKAIANAALARLRDPSRYFLTGEDLMNLPVVPLHQDLAHLAALGIAHAERNGHHYVRGLAHLSDSERTACLTGHGDLYTESDGLAALSIANGQLTIGSLQCPGLGVAAEIDVDSMVPLEEWSFDSLA